MSTSSANMSMDCETENGFRKRRVCIIGAGMSGLVATKYLLNLNMDLIVFEAKQGIGGVWRETFASTRVQTPRPEYEFSDFPWPDYITAQQPTHSEVMDYFQSYSIQFGLLDHIHLNSKVVEIRYIGQEYYERSLEHAGLWSKNGGPYADIAVWDVGVQKSNGESIERWAIFKFMELYICWKLSLRKYGLVPDHSFVEDLSACNTFIYPGNLISKAEEGCILFRKSPNWSFSSNGVVLDDGTEVETDFVVFATGYDAEKKLKNLLPEPFADVLQKSAGVVPLYRGLIHPQIPHMAILGYSESLSNLHISEMRSRWLSHFISGKFVLPSMKVMEADIDNHSKHWKRITPFYWKSCYGAFQIWDNDALCRDMGWNPMRKKNWFCELFSPYSNLDYRGP